MHSVVYSVLTLYNTALNVQCDMQRKYLRNNTVHFLFRCWQVAAHSACNQQLDCLPLLPCLHFPLACPRYCMKAHQYRPPPLPLSTLPYPPSVCRSVLTQLLSWGVRIFCEHSLFSSPGWLELPWEVRDGLVHWDVGIRSQAEDAVAYC
jgi:hypothetical protein